MHVNVIYRGKRISVDEKDLWKDHSGQWNITEGDSMYDHHVIYCVVTRCDEPCPDQT